MRTDKIYDHNFETDHKTLPLSCSSIAWKMKRQDARTRYFNRLWSSSASESELYDQNASPGSSETTASVRAKDPVGSRGTSDGILRHHGHPVVEQNPAIKSNESRGPIPKDSLLLIGGLAAIAVVLLGSLALYRGVLATSGLPPWMHAEQGSLIAKGGLLLSSPSPSSMPTSGPSTSPSSHPSVPPTAQPSSCPSVLPSREPSSQPSHTPSNLPSLMPTNRPSYIPSTAPSPVPSVAPSSNPSSRPSHKPSRSPTDFPSSAPSILPSSSPTDTPIVFYCMGDIPSSPEDFNILKSQVDSIPSDAQFVVHVGDIKKGTETNCTRDMYTSASSVLANSKSPVFILPGDNDIVDCSNQFIAKMFWAQSFKSFENHWKHAFSVDRPTDTSEDFAFFFSNVLFMGVNVVGSRDLDDSERERSLTNELEWALGKISAHRNEMVGLVVFSHDATSSKYRPFFRPLAKAVKKLGIPCLCLHGHGHKWEYKQKAFGVRNMIRVQVDSGRRAPPLRVRFRSDAEEPFEFDRRK